MRINLTSLIIFLNLQLDGKKLVFKAKTPLAEVFAYSDHHEWGRLRDVFGTLDWKEIAGDVDIYCIFC